MMKSAEEIRCELLNGWKENCFSEYRIELDSNPNTYVAFVTPCGYDVKSLEDCEYFLVDGPLPWLGGSNLDDVAKDLSSMDELIDESLTERKRLQEYYDRHHNDSTNDWFDFYSDWHKDVYGYRPR